MTIGVVYLFLVFVKKLLTKTKYKKKSCNNQNLIWRILVPISHASLKFAGCGLAHSRNTLYFL